LKKSATKPKKPLVILKKGKMISKNHADQYLSYSSRVNLSKEKKPSTANQENVSFYEAALKIKEIPRS